MAAPSERQNPSRQITPVHGTERTYQHAKGEMSKSDGEKIERLLQELRLRCMAAEPKFSGDVIVWPSKSAAPGGSELATLGAINLSNAEGALGQGCKPAVFPGWISSSSWTACRS
jgi:subtilisin